MEEFRYTGQVSNGVPDGYGTADVYIFGLFWAGGFAGFWRKGYPEGYGIIKAADQGPLSGAYYKGDWLNGGMAGNNGIFKYPGGASYQGIFNQNGPLYGIITYGNGDKWTGSNN